jgi:4-hydroxy-tetrahydrodipicolinate synthase
MIEAYVAGNVTEALRWHRRLLPIYTGIFATQGCILVKDGLRRLGRGNGRVRSPMSPATDAESTALFACLREAGLVTGDATGARPTDERPTDGRGNPADD